MPCCAPTGALRAQGCAVIWSGAPPFFCCLPFCASPSPGITAHLDAPRFSESSESESSLSESESESLSEPELLLLLSSLPLLLLLLLLLSSSLPSSLEVWVLSSSSSSLLGAAQKRDAMVVAGGVWRLAAVCFCC